MPVKISSFAGSLARPARLLALAATLGTLGGLLSSCAGSHGSLSQKTRWYKHHSTSKALPCPCGH
jgi:hypothetical protein